MQQPWDIFWEAQAYKGKTAILDDSREGRCWACYHNGEAPGHEHRGPGRSGPGRSTT